jgi:hypothetical protein
VKKITDKFTSLTSYMGHSRPMRPVLPPVYVRFGPILLKNALVETVKAY